MAAEDLDTLIESYLQEHKDVAAALELFRISLEEYRRSLLEPRTSSANTTNYVEG